jgi:hypothetical protein
VWLSSEKPAKRNDTQQIARGRVGRSHSSYDLVVFGAVLSWGVYGATLHRGSPVLYFKPQS